MAGQKTEVSQETVELRRAFVQIKKICNMFRGLPETGMQKIEAVADEALNAI